MKNCLKHITIFGILVIKKVMLLMKKFKLEKEVKAEIISSIQEYFINERDEEIGNLSAELLLQFIIEKVGPAIYNQGIHDAHSFVSEKIEELYGLEK